MTNKFSHLTQKYNHLKVHVYPMIGLWPFFALLEPILLIKTCFHCSQHTLQFKSIYIKGNCAEKKFDTKVFIEIYKIIDLVLAGFGYLDHTGMWGRKEQYKVTVSQLAISLFFFLKFLNNIFQRDSEILPFFLE